MLRGCCMAAIAKVKTKAITFEAARAGRMADAMRTYRGFVEAVADDKPLDGDDVDRLLDAMSALQIDSEKLNADVDDYKWVQAQRADLGDASARIRQHNEEGRRLAKLSEELRVQSIAAEGKSREQAILAQSVASQRGEIERREASNPRLFGEIAASLARLGEEPKEQLQPQDIRPWHRSGDMFASRNR